jgi:hypothetical protein
VAARATTVTIDVAVSHGPGGVSSAQVSVEMLINASISTHFPWSQPLS